MTTTEIRISDWKPIERGSLRGVFTLILPSGLILKNCFLFELNGKKWVNGPSQSFTGRDGKTTYSQLLGFTNRATQDAFNADVLAALDSYLGVTA